MTRRMADSITPTDIPVNDPRTGQPWGLIGGYIDGIYAWSASGWARFPNSVHVRVAVNPATNDGHVIDRETGDATASQAVDWVLMRRAAGTDPTVYCGLSDWPNVISTFASRGVAQPHYWVAAYPGAGEVQQTSSGITSVAHQFSDTPGGHWDESVVVDVWPGIDTPKKKDDNMFWFIGNTATGDVALLYPNGDFVGVGGTNWSAVVSANGVPKLDVSQAIWTDMAARAGNARQDLANRTAAAQKAAKVGEVVPAPVTNNVTGLFPNHWTLHDDGNGVTSAVGSTV